MEEYFTNQKIIRILCKSRAKHSFARHKKHMMRKISTHSNADKCNIIPDKDLEFILLQRILPSRRSWAKLNTKERKDLYKDNLKRNEVRIYKSYLNKKNDFEKGVPVDLWYKELLIFCGEIRKRLEEINIGDYDISSPKISGIEKKEKNNLSETIVYRPIAIYDTMDRIITSLTSKYLITTFDPYFLNCSFAFRASIEGKIKTHHDAISAIFKYKKRNKRLWVSECDIAKFFDTVNHTLIIEKLDSFIKYLSSKGVVVDNKARSVFISFLRSYAFNKDVFPINVKPIWFDKKGMKRGTFKWVKDILINKFGEHYINNSRIGVPQGNAISCFIANLIMHDIDKKVLEVNENIFYIRFCDDMVLMHQNQEVCNEGLKAYKKAIDDNFLVYHEPKKIERYYEKENAKFFWKSKSKEPFFWGHKFANKLNVPWVAFVGYQIRYDGLIRIRKDSLKKEIKKQGIEIYRIHKALGKRGNDISTYNINNRWSKQKILKSAEERLIAMSVGKIKMHNHTSLVTNGLCWVSGFKQIQDNIIIRSQMRLLDKKRKQRIARLNRALPDNMVSKIKKKKEKLNKMI